MARNAMFTRKGAPPSAAATITKEPANGADDAADAHTLGGADDAPEMSGNDEQHDPNDIAVCPSCGCTFNDETGKVLAQDHPQHPSQMMPEQDGAPEGQDNG